MKYSKSKAKHKMNALGLEQVPFLFDIEFEMNEETFSNAKKSFEKTLKSLNR